MPLGSLFGAAERNAERRRQEGDDWRRAKERHKQAEDAREEVHDFNAETYYNRIADNEANLRFQEENLIFDYEQAVARQNYEFDAATRAYNRSNAEHYQQKNFNIMAEANAMMEQNAKKRDDLLAVMFDESQSVIDYVGNTAGIKLSKGKKIQDANFKGAQIEAKFTNDLGLYQIERRKQRADSQIEAQKAIVAGMKMAGEIRAKAGAGRSGAKAVLGVMAESGATRAAIANGLMYAEQGIDLGIAQLKDMLILDQTMVLAAKDFAENEYELKAGKLDAVRALDKVKTAASKQSIEDRDKVVRRMITHARQQADFKAEASVLMKPERLPAPTDPRERWAQYDDPETEDYVEMLLRPTLQEFPTFRRTPPPDREDFRYGRENVGLSNFGDVMKIGGLLATGIGGIGAMGGLGMGAAGGTGTFLGMGASSWSTLGTGLQNFSSSFYPRGY